MVDFQPRRGLRIDAVWDIETADWDQFVCGALWTRDSGVQVFGREDDLAECLLSLPAGSVVWAHAGGRFDVLWLLDWCNRRSRVPAAQIRLSGSSIASLAIKQGPTLRDSCRLMPVSLREACTMFPGCEQKQRLDFPCSCGRECGGYCAIAIKMPRHMRGRLEEYLEADILSLKDTLEALSTYADESKLLLAGTVASTAWRTAKERCGLDDAKWELPAYHLARLGYKGGHTDVGMTAAPRVFRYDRASAYPAELRQPVPCGPARVVDACGAKRAWAKQRPGIYAAIVDVPDSHVAPLPLRLDARIVYPWGRFAGQWTRDELMHAESRGTTIMGLTEGVVWDKEKPMLREHVDHCFALRSQATSKALKTWLKFVANSLTGAFAQDPTQDVVALGDYSDDPSYEPVGRYDWIWRKQVFRVSQRAHVHWAATLTGRARIELDKQIEHAGNHWAYSDTDSCMATKRLTRRLGHEIGEWQFEGEAHGFKAVAPKVYTYVDDKGKPFARAKGIPDAVREWGRIAGGKSIEINRGVKSLLVASRGDRIFARNDTSRTVSPRDGWVGGRLRDGDRTRAPHVDDLPNLPK